MRRGGCTRIRERGSREGGSLSGGRIRALEDVTRERDATAKLEITTEQDLKPQRVKITRGYTSGNRAKST